MNVSNAAVRKYRLNNRLNLIISSLILFFCATSIIASVLAKPEENFWFEFRYMTVNGTVFTGLVSVLMIVCAVAEIRTGHEIELRKLYYFRLSSAVTEVIIAVVILMSFLPFVPDSPNLLTYESFSMHVVIPLLSVISFLLNRSPVGYLHPLLRLNCAWLITLYAAVVITLILLGFIPPDKIPYSFMDVYSRPVWYLITFGCFIYSFTYVLSVLFTEGNRRLSKRWIEEKSG